MDEAITGGPAPLEAGEVVGAEPVVSGVLGPCRGGTVQVAVDLDEVVGLVPRPVPVSVVTGPGGGPGAASDAAQAPAGLLRDVAGERVQQGFAGLDVASDDAPAVGEEPSAGAAPLDEGGAVAVEDGGPDRPALAVGADRDLDVGLHGHAVLVV
ncbi:hypothetical protein JQK87_30245 [Streptomyces sp. G44]|nr:hypothetical protein [Streptomyces sp. G44]